MRRRTLIRASTAVFALGLLAPARRARAADGLVIVTTADSPIQSLTPAEVRKLYLGVPLVAYGIEVLPVLNRSDPELQEMFLQKVLFMSGQVYERRMLAKLYREGGNRIADIDARAQLQPMLAADPRRITYVRRGDVGPAMKVIAQP